MNNKILELCKMVIENEGEVKYTYCEGIACYEDECPFRNTIDCQRSPKECLSLAKDYINTSKKNAIETIKPIIAFDEIKALCNEHDNCLKKSKILDEVTPENNNVIIKSLYAGITFKLTSEEIKLLKDFNDDKGLKIENRINELLN